MLIRNLAVMSALRLRSFMLTLSPRRQSELAFFKRIVS